MNKRNDFRVFLGCEIDRLRSVRGLKQKQQSKKEIDDTVNEIIKVCAASIIPLRKQAAIIHANIVNDPDMIALNATKVKQWFDKEIDSNRAQYMALMQAKEDPELEKRQKENEEYYKSQLEKKKESNPDYDPVAEGKKRIRQMISKDKDIQKIKRQNLISK